MTRSIELTITHDEYTKIRSQLLDYINLRPQASFTRPGAPVRAVFPRQPACSAAIPAAQMQCMAGTALPQEACQIRFECITQAASVMGASPVFKLLASVCNPDMVFACAASAGSARASLHHPAGTEIPDRTKTSDPNGCMWDYTQAKTSLAVPACLVSDPCTCRCLCAAMHGADTHMQAACSWPAPAGATPLTMQPAAYSKPSLQESNPHMSPVPIQAFPASLHEGDYPSQAIPLDLSEDLEMQGPATSPNLLASFVRVTEGEEFRTRAVATSQAFYVIR